jgi:hypothetical protein
MTTRSRVLRRATTGAALTSFLFAGLAAFLAPTASAGDARAGCLPDTVDGVHVCTTVPSGPPPSIVLGEVFVDDDIEGLSLTGALVVLEQCTDQGCSVVATAFGSGNDVHTDAVVVVPGSRYVTTASWVDSAGHQHHGVQKG